MLISKYLIIPGAAIVTFALAVATGCARDTDDHATKNSSKQELHLGQPLKPAATPSSSQTLASARPEQMTASRTRAVGDGQTKLQIGPWSPAAFNIEEPFINIIHASTVSWEGGGKNTRELYEEGFIDPNTGLPVRLPNGATLTSGVYFTAYDKTYYDGDWVLEWDGDADIGMLFINNRYQRRISKNRLEFTRNAVDGLTPAHAAIQVRRLKGPLKSLRLYRKENETALKSGKIYSPRFIDTVSRGDIIRTMDLQEANRVFIRRIEDVATMDEFFWNNTLQQPKAFDFPHRSMPIEALFALAAEADTALWFHAPLELGAHLSFFDPSIRGGGVEEHASKYSTLAEENVSAILDSPEWDRYADQVVAALVKTGYPPDRTLYTTVSNEVWNFALRYHFTTRYAWGFGKGYAAASGRSNWSYREGYGVLLARWAEALDAALVRAGRTQPVIYVVEGQAANPDTTTRALKGMKAYVEDRERVWADFAPRLGVSVASYWGSRQSWKAVMGEDEWPAAIASDPVGAAKRLADFYIGGPDHVIATKSWVLKKFSNHAFQAEQYGVKLIGAYEGGSHDERPRYINGDFYRNYLWGPEGARVNTAVNDALAEAYPGIILSNYATVGPPGGQPWFDGFYDENNDMQRSWAKYERR